MILNQASQRLDFPNAIRISAAILGAFLLMANFLYSAACSERKIARVAAHHKLNFRAMLLDWPYSISILSWVGCFAWIPQHQVACYPSFDGRRAFCINLGLFFPCELWSVYLVSFRLMIFYRRFLPTIVRGLPEIGAVFCFLSCTSKFQLFRGYIEFIFLIKLAILNAGGAFGRVLPNFLADRFGTYNMLLLSLYTSSMLVFVILAIHTPAGMTCFALLYGFWSGSCMFDPVFY